MYNKKMCGIALEADGTARVVELTATLRAVNLSRAQTFPAGDVEPASGWGRALSRAREEGFYLDGCVMGLPDSMTYRKALTFPFRARRRIMQVLPSELDGEIPVPSDAVVADFLPGGSADGGAKGMAVACSRQTLLQVLDLPGEGSRIGGVQTLSVGLATACRAAGLSDGVAVLCSEGDILVVGMRSSRLEAVRRLATGGTGGGAADFIRDSITALAAEGDQVVLGCPEDLTAELESSLTQSGLTVRRFRNWHPMGGMDHAPEDVTPYMTAFGLALRALGRKESFSFDLRQGPFRPVTPLASMKAPLLRTAGVAVLALVLATASAVTGISRVKGDYERYSAQLTQEFRELFPDTRIVNEVAQVSEKLQQLDRRARDLAGFEGAGALHVLTRLSAAIPGEIQLKVEELSYDSSKLRLDGTISSFDAVDRLKGALEKEPLFSGVQLQNAKVGADASKVNFRLQMEIR
ncbi:MAG: PilN domain-containing protein [bacterium]|nr:MAG: PilN domain-containing protein [bacterium]